MTTKKRIIYWICIAILFLVGVGIIQKAFIVYSNINQSLSQVTTSVPNIPNVIQPQLNTLNEDLANFPSYSEAEHKQLFKRISYLNKQSAGLSEFASTIAKAVGLDQSSQLEMTRGVMNSTVLILSANMAYADMTYNFLCRLAKISKTFHYVVVAQDISFYNFLQAHNIPSVSGNVIHPISTENAETYRSSGFNAISIAKMIATRVVIELGYNVLFSDVDIAWNKNPVPLIPTDVDLAIQSNSGTNGFSLGDEANAGFYFLRSNDRSMALLDDTIDRARKDPSIDDQSHFGNALRDWRVSKKAIYIMDGKTAPWTYSGYRPFTFRILRPYCFQTGQVARDAYNQKVEPPYDGKEQNIILVHANYLVGHRSKVDFLKSHALWDLDDQKFQTSLADWKSKGKTNKVKQNQNRQINYQLALERLVQVCVNLVA